MNKDEAMRLAIDISSKPMPWNGEYTFRTKKELLTFANACETIGMEKAAKISDSETAKHDEFCTCADAIRSAILTPTPHEPPTPAT